MAKLFKITRDRQGVPAYGIEFVDARKINNSFGPGDEAYIVLQSDDKDVIFSPGGGTFYISSDPNPAIPAISGGEMQETNSVQNFATINLVNWPLSADSGNIEKRLYVKSLTSQTISIVVLK